MVTIFRHRAYARRFLQFCALTRFDARALMRLSLRQPD